MGYIEQPKGRAVPSAGALQPH